MMRQEHHKLRNVQPLDGEEQWLILHERYGFLEEAPPEDDCLLLSSKRIICFSRGEGRSRSTLLSLQDVDSVELTDVARSLKPLLTGGLLVLAAVMLAWLATIFGMGGFLSWLIGGILVLLGAITASTFFVAEDTAMITFRNRAVEVSLPLRTPQAVHDAHSTAHWFFQAKAGQVPTTDQATIPRQESIEPKPLDDTPAPEAVTHPQEPAQVDSSEQAASAFLPDIPTDQQGSTQSEGWRDV